jgi:hypothetical protein
LADIGIYLIDRRDNIPILGGTKLHMVRKVVAFTDNFTQSIWAFPICGDITTPAVA